jgi:hypothetical protein
VGGMRRSSSKQAFLSLEALRASFSFVCLCGVADRVALFVLLDGGALLEYDLRPLTLQKRRLSEAVLT